jgi:DNA-binding response OmpR family regulator
MKKILLIEDDLDLQRVYSQKLEHEGFQVVLAQDATQGLYSAKSDKPNLILLDIMLPGKMNGFELLETFKKDNELKKIPVIVLTNLDTEKSIAEKIGATDYLVKANTDLDALVEEVKGKAK